MKISLDTAEAIAKRVNKRLKDWGFDSMSIQPRFVIMVSLVMRELRAESKRQATQNPDEESNV